MTGRTVFTSGARPSAPCHTGWIRPPPVRLFPGTREGSAVPLAEPLARRPPRGLRQDGSAASALTGGLNLVEPRPHAIRQPREATEHVATGGQEMLDRGLSRFLFESKLNGTPTSTWCARASRK